MEFNMGKLIPIEMNEKIAKKFLKRKESQQSLTAIPYLSICEMNFVMN